MCETIPRSRHESGPGPDGFTTNWASRAGIVGSISFLSGSICRRICNGRDYIGTWYPFQKLSIHQRVVLCRPIPFSCVRIRTRIPFLHRHGRRIDARSSTIPNYSSCRPSNYVPRAVRLPVSSDGWRRSDGPNAADIPLIRLTARESSAARFRLFAACALCHHRALDTTGPGHT